MTTRVHPTPAAVLRGTIDCHGRLYTPVIGTPQDVPDADVKRLTANGWLCFTANQFGTAGTTAQRPTQDQNGRALQPNTFYSDTTLSKVIFWDGATWRDMFSSAAV